MDEEKLRVLTFSTLEFEDGDWDGPHRDEDVMSYKSKVGAASLKITRDGSTIFDADFPKSKTIYVVDDVVHLPEGASAQERQ